MATSYTHEGLVALLRSRPEVALALLRDAHGIALPAASLVQLDAADLTDLDPAERRADVVLLFVEASGKTVYALIVEVQLAWDRDKPYRWPAYASVLRDRRRCDVDVVVLCVDQALAERLAAPIRLGRGPSVFQPLVLGPGVMPIVTDIDRARREPELAVLSALSHHATAQGADIGFAAVLAAAGLDETRRGLYYDLVWGALGEATRKAIEERMATTGYQYQSDFAKTYFAQGEATGEAKGEAKALLLVLASRGIDVADDSRARVLACTDLAQLERWLARAVRIASAAELFEGT